MASSVNLGEALEQFVDGAVKSGRFGSRSEVLREGLRMLQHRERAWQRFDAEIQKAIDSVEARGTIPIEKAFGQVRQRLDEQFGKRAA